MKKLNNKQDKFCFRVLVTMWLVPVSIISPIFRRFFISSFRPRYVPIRHSVRYMRFHYGRVPKPNEFFGGAPIHPIAATILCF